MLALDPKSLETRSLARNEVPFRQDDKVTAIYFIESGVLRIERRTFDGRTLILGTTPANAPRSSDFHAPLSRVTQDFAAAAQ